MVLVYDSGMKASYVLLSISDLLLMALTIGVGLMVGGHEGLFARHFLLGVLTGMYTCFVHIVLFMYFVVQEKIVTQSILHHAMDAAYSPKIQAMKGRALKLSALGIVSILVTVGLGAAIGIAVGPTAHLVAAFAALLVNAVAFYLQYVLIVEYGVVSRAAFGE